MSDATCERTQDGSRPKVGPYATITEDVRFGRDVTVYGYCNLYGCRIGDESRIGPFVEIQRGVQIGARVRVQSHTFICTGVTIEDDVFIGHNVTFVNDRYPTARKAAAGMWLREDTRVESGASIGSGSVILCGVQIGAGAVVGAGSVVTRNVAPHTVVAGVPAAAMRTLPPNAQGSGGAQASDAGEKA